MNELDFSPEGYRARCAYEAYARSTGGKTFDGRDMPPWSGLGDRIQAAWVAAAEAVVFSLRTSNGKEE